MPSALQDRDSRQSRSQRLSVTAVGRARPGSQQARHGIKAVDRLLSNAKLQRERLPWWQALVGKLLKAEHRSLLVLAESYDESQVGSREVQLAFLHT
jgi:hypothetical protein